MTTMAPRFTGLRDALATVTAENGTRIARIRASVSGKAYTGRLGTTKGPSAGTAPAPTKEASPTPKPKAGAPPKPVEFAIPADVAALGSEAVVAYKRGHARAEARLAQLSTHPAVAGRSAEAIDLFKRGMSNADIIAQFTREERAKAADAVWEKAHAAIFGDKRSAAEPVSETVWDRAYARLNGTVAANSPAEPGKSDDIWDRAYASLNRNGAR